MIPKHYYLTYRDGWPWIETKADEVAKYLKEITVDYFKCQFSYMYVFHLYCTEPEYLDAKKLLNKVFQAKPTVVSKLSEKRFWKETSTYLKVCVAKKVKETKYGYRVPLYCF